MVGNIYTSVFINNSLVIIIILLKLLLNLSILGILLTLTVTVKVMSSYFLSKSRTPYAMHFAAWILYILNSQVHAITLQCIIQPFWTKFLQFPSSFFLTVIFISEKILYFPICCWGGGGGCGWQQDMICGRFLGEIVSYLCTPVHKRMIYFYKFSS